MAITKGFGYTIRCDQDLLSDPKPGEEQTVGQCPESLFIVTKNHNHGATGGPQVMAVALQNGYALNMQTKKWACNVCAARLKVRPDADKKPKLYGPDGQSAN